MTNDIDIYRAANEYIKQYGDDADIWAAKIGRSKMIKKLALLLAVCFLVISASNEVQAAKKQRTDQLLWECTGETMGEMGKFLCAKYIDGMLDMHSLLIPRRAVPYFCLPRTGISIDQAMRIFISWANKHPTELHKTARASVVIAIANAFPCKKK